MKKCFLTEKGPKAIGPYSTLVQVGSSCYLSGMLGVVRETGKLAEGGVEAQARQAFENMKMVLAEVGLSTVHIVKTTVFLKDFNDFGKVNAIYAEYFGPDFPARSCLEVARLPMDALIEIEAITCTE